MHRPDETPTSVDSPLGDLGRVGRVFLRGIVEDATMTIDLAGFMNAARRTGVLTVMFGAVRKSIYFGKGSIIAASSNQPEDRFGDIMFRRGMITRRDLGEALKRVRPDRKIGNVLLARHLISPRDLWKIIRIQIEEILYSTLLIESGEFTVAHFDAAQVPARTALNTQHLLLEGLRRKDEMENLRTEIPPNDRVMTRARMEMGVTLDEQERRVYDLVDGRRTVDELRVESGLGEFDSVRVLHHLIKVGLVKEAYRDVFPGEAGGGGTTVGAIIATYNGAIAHVHLALAEVGQPMPFGEDVNTFFSDVPREIAPLFNGVSPDPDGRLPPEPLFANLKIAQVDDKVHLLQQALAEYVQFLMFMARETLDYDRVEQLERDVQSLLNGLE